MFDEPSIWAPPAWRSCWLKKAVNSTLGADALALGDGLRHLGWVKSMFMQLLGKDFIPSDRQHLSNMSSLAVTDCKSLCDAQFGVGTFGSFSDKRTAIDLVVFVSY